VDRFTIGEKDYPEIAILSLRDLSPPANAPVSLCHFFDGRLNYAFDPFVADCGAISPASQRIKVESGLHSVMLSESSHFRCSLTTELSGRSPLPLRTGEHAIYWEHGAPTMIHGPLQRVVRHQ